MDISEWCKADSAFSSKAFCILCQKSIGCKNGGILQIMQHAKGIKHKSVMDLRTSQIQRHFMLSPVPAPSTRPAETAPNLVLDQTLTEKTITAEVLWALKTAHADWSFASSDGTPQLFCKMFPGPISDEYRMSRTKVSYLISDGLGPYFKKCLCRDVSLSTTGYTLHYDETGNSEGRKQCDLLVRYWSNQSNQIEVRFLKTLYFGHAIGQNVSKSILDALQEEGYQIPLSGLISLSSDGPNVNKTIWKSINETLKGTGFQGLLLFVPCNIHVTHNAFRAGLGVYGEPAEELALDLFLWIKSSPCRREDFQNVLIELELNDQLFIRHVQSRWLTLIPALERIVKKWKGIQQYFLVDLPKLSCEAGTTKALETNDRYLRTCKKLKDKTTIVQIQFLLSVAPVFNKFLLFFQTEGPLVHILHNAMSEMLKGIMGRFVKSGVLQSVSGKNLLSVSYDNLENQLSLQQMEVGQDTRSALAKLFGDQQRAPLLGMRKFFVTVTKYLSGHFPLDSSFLRDLTHLYPLMRKDESSVSAIRRVALLLPTVDDNQASLVTDEWKVYQGQEIPEDCFSTVDNDGKITFKRNDSYWAKVLESKTPQGNSRYPNLDVVVKSALSIAHGNADVERSLSANKRTLTSDRVSLGDKTVNALRIVKEEARLKDGAENFVIGKPLLEAAKNAHRDYERRLKEEKERTEREKRTKEQEKQEKTDKSEELRKLNENKMTLAQKEKDVNRAQKEAAEGLKSAENLFSEANQRLSSAIKKKDFNEAEVAKGLLEIATKKMEGARSSLKRNMESRDSLNTKKQKLIDAFSKAVKDKSHE